MSGWVAFLVLAAFGAGVLVGSRGARVLLKGVSRG